MAPFSRFTRLPSLPPRSGKWSLVLLLIAATAHAAMGQAIDLAPVAVDDSPGAERAFAEARLQSRDNPDRSASLLYDILGEYGQRVIARPERPDQYGSVRRAVIDFLLAHPGVLRSWRRTVGSEAEDLLRTEGAEAVYAISPMGKWYTPIGPEICSGRPLDWCWCILSGPLCDAFASGAPFRTCFGAFWAHPRPFGHASGALLGAVRPRRGTFV